MERKYIGQRLPRVDGADKVTGRAIFAADISLPQMLYGKLLRSPHAHARIKRIDVSRALALEGVKAVVTAADLPPTTGPQIMVRGEVEVDLSHICQLALAQDKVLYHSHPVAAVAAITPQIAEWALELIEVEYEPLPAVLDAEEAMRPEAPLLHPDLFTQTRQGKAEKPSNIAALYTFGRGDVEAGFRQADAVRENTFRTQMVHQGYLEPLACVALAEPGGRIRLWSSTQGTFSVRSQLSAILGLPSSWIKVIPVEVGGGFGGKINALLELPAILLSQKTGRPVKIVLTREEVLRASFPAPPAIITIKTGATREGKLTAVSMKAIFDAGAFPISPVVTAYFTGLAPYKVDNLKFEGYEVVTNKPKIGALRAPGAPQGAFAVESQMDMMAQALRLDPLEFRRINAVAEGDPLPVGSRGLNRIGLKPLLERLAAHPAWTSPMEGPYRGRGLALGFWPGAIMTSSAQVVLQEDGSFSVALGSVDLTGTRTTMLQVAADELGVEPSRISMSLADTDSIGFTEVSGGSRITYTMSNAVHLACQDLLRQLKERAAGVLEVGVEEVEYKQGVFRAKGAPDKAATLAELGSLSLRRGGPMVGKGVTSRLQQAPVFAAHIADVEVDPETGKVNVLRYTAFQDVGLAVNPTQVEGQLQGGAAQGIGWSLLEGYRFGKDGALQNATMLDYRTPTATDVPMIEAVLVEVPASDGPYGIRGVGETPIIPPPACLANAIFRATAARLKELPMTPEAVFWAMKRER